MSSLLETTLKTLSEKLAEDISVIDMRNVNPFTDYFVIVTSRNLRHGASLANDLIKEIEKNGYSIRAREGDDESPWILVDMNEVIVHIFTEDARKIYRLDVLWADQPSQKYTD